MAAAPDGAGGPDSFVIDVHGQAAPVFALTVRFVTADGRRRPEYSVRCRVYALRSFMSLASRRSVADFLNPGRDFSAADAGRLRQLAPSARVCTVVADLVSPKIGEDEAFGLPPVIRLRLSSARKAFVVGEHPGSVVIVRNHEHVDVAGDGKRRSAYHPSSFWIDAADGTDGVLRPAAVGAKTLPLNLVKRLPRDDDPPADEHETNGDC